MIRILKRLWFLIFLLCMGFLLAACDAGYVQENGRWVFVDYNESAGRVVREIAQHDEATFEEINSEYARDKFRVYHTTEPIEGADPKTFKRVGGLYYKDNDQVFYVDRPLPGADPDSFRRLKYTYWNRDKNNVYVTDNPVNPCDLESFRQINETWARDDCWYYAQNFGEFHPIAELDIDTFEILDGAWAKDCCRVFYAFRLVEGADPATFYTINQFRGRDKAWAYLMGTRQRTLQEDLELEERLKQRKETQGVKSP